MPMLLGQQRPPVLYEVEAPRRWEDLEPYRALDEAHLLSVRAQAADLRLVLDARKLLAHGSTTRRPPSQQSESSMLAELDSMVRRWQDAGIEGVRVDDPPSDTALRLGTNGRHRQVAFDSVGAVWTADAVAQAIDACLRSGGRPGSTRVWSVSPPTSGEGCSYHGSGRDRAALVLALALPGSPYLDAGRFPLMDPVPARPGGHPDCELCALVAGKVHAESLVDLFRAASLTRATHAAFSTDECSWEPASPGLVQFVRGSRLRVVLNLAGTPLRCAGPIVLASEPVTAGQLPADACAWLAL